MENKYKTINKEYEEQGKILVSTCENSKDLKSFEEKIVNKKFISYFNKKFDFDYINHIKVYNESCRYSGHSVTLGIYPETDMSFDITYNIISKKISLHWASTCCDSKTEISKFLIIAGKFSEYFFNDDNVQDFYNQIKSLIDIKNKINENDKLIFKTQYKLTELFNQLKNIKINEYTDLNNIYNMNFRIIESNYSKFKKNEYVIKFIKKRKYIETHMKFINSDTKEEWTFLNKCELSMINNELLLTEQIKKYLFQFELNKVKEFYQDWSKK
ncbi:MAG: hypothetical protein HRU03_01540 [Nanoarchaeales archaeon]|nr:hypothetical protein [Nanoarchaeales archaeon]